jgi:peptide/nickel transport system permease protein
VTVDRACVKAQNSGRNKISERRRCPHQSSVSNWTYDLPIPLFALADWVPELVPITIAGQIVFWEYAPAGCAIPGQARLRYPDGHTEMIEDGCQKPVTFADLTGSAHQCVAIVFGDFGLSQVILRDRPDFATSISKSPRRIPWTSMGISSLIALLIGVPLGVYSAVRQYSRFDYAMTTVSFVGSSLPTFVIGIICILVFAIAAKEAGLPYLPPGSAVANSDYDSAVDREWWLPSLHLDRVLHFINAVWRAGIRQYRRV